jgi:hypothetical protein
MEEYKAKVSIDTTSATQSINNLGDAISDVGDELVPLTSQMGEMEDKLMLMAHAGDTSSEEFKKLSKEVAGMRKTIRETDAGIEALSMTTSQKLGGALGGVASGFELVQGAMGAMGADSAEVEEALLKVQSAMAMAQGVQGIREAVPAFKAMGSTAVTAFNGIKGAIGATGIGLLVVAIGALYANFDKLSGIVDWAKEKFEGMGDGIKSVLTIALFPFIIAIETIKAGLVALGIIESDEDKARKAQHQRRMAQVDARMEKEAEAAKQRKENFDNEQKNYDRAIALAEAEGKSTLGLQKQKIEGSIKFQEQQIKEMENSIAAIKFVQEQSGWMAKGLKDIVDQAESDLNTMKNDLKDAQTDLKLLDINAKKEAAARAEEARQAELERLAAENDAKRELYVQDAEMQREIDALAAEEALAAQEAQQAESLRLAQEYQDQLLALPEEEIAIEEEKFSKLEELQMKWATGMKTHRKEMNDAMIDGASNMFATLSSLSELFQGKSKKAQERAFKVQKAAQIGQATIDTFKAATGAFSSMSSIPVVGPALGAVAAAAAVAAGLANIKKIASAKFDGGTVPSDGGGGGVGDTGGGGTSSIMSPNFNIVGNNPVNQLAQLGSQPVQAYVVSGEVTTAQSLDRNRIKNATL